MLWYETAFQCSASYWLISASGVRHYGVGRHLWTLDKEQIVMFNEVNTTRSKFAYTSTALISMASSGTQSALSSAPLSS